MFLSVLFVTWQEPETRRIFPIARLLALSTGRYEFGYIRAVRDARAKGFAGLPGFEDIERVYVSAALPSLFEHRAPARGRQVSPAGESEPANDTLDAAPLTLFVPRDDGKSAERLEVFAPPMPGPTGELWGIFAARGTAHLAGANQAVEALAAHERVLLKAEPQNAYNPRALLITRTDGAPIGHVPDYLANELAAARASLEQVQVRIQRVLRLNFPPATPLYQVLCHYTCAAELGRALFHSDLYQPVSDRAARVPS
jgi:hypothetical protein